MESLLKSCDNQDFKSLRTLLQIIKKEKIFQIQVFSLEPCELFEKVLMSKNIKYSKIFTSGVYKLRSLTLLLKDENMEHVELDSKLILYSNERDARFIPYKFVVSEEEKNTIIANKWLQKTHQHASLSATYKNNINAPLLSAQSLTVVQATILYCMIREKKFARLYQEVYQVNNDIDNKFVVLCELNLLVKYRFCRRVGDAYHLNISKEMLLETCKNIGFEKEFS